MRKTRGRSTRLGSHQRRVRVTQWINPIYQKLAHKRNQCWTEGRNIFHQQFFLPIPNLSFILCVPTLQEKRGQLSLIQKNLHLNLCYWTGSLVPQVLLDIFEFDAKNLEGLQVETSKRSLNFSMMQYVFFSEQTLDNSVDAEGAFSKRRANSSTNCLINKVLSKLS